MTALLTPLSGAGPRVCIGAQFALAEAVLVLAPFLRRFRLDLATQRPVTTPRWSSTSATRPKLGRQYRDLRGRLPGVALPGCVRPHAAFAVAPGPGLRERAFEVRRVGAVDHVVGRRARRRPLHLLDGSAEGLAGRERAVLSPCSLHLSRT